MVVIPKVVRVIELNAVMVRILNTVMVCTPIAALVYSSNVVMACTPNAFMVCCYGIFTKRCCVMHMERF